MLNFIRTTKFAATAIAIVFMVAGAPSASNAQTGAVRINFTKVGFIVGVGGGSGVLTFAGKTYQLGIGGVSVGSFGATTADLVGRAYNLRRASDIAGTYTAVSAGVAVAGGAKTARLQNSNGVILELRGPQIGLDLSVALSGMSVSLR